MSICFLVLRKNPAPERSSQMPFRISCGKMEYNRFAAATVRRDTFSWFIEWNDLTKQNLSPAVEQLRAVDKGKLRRTSYQANRVLQITLNALPIFVSQFEMSEWLWLNWICSISVLSRLPFVPVQKNTIYMRNERFTASMLIHFVQNFVMCSVFNRMSCHDLRNVCIPSESMVIIWQKITNNTKHCISFGSTWKCVAKAQRK